MMNKYISNGDGDNEICSNDHNNNNISMVAFIGLDTNNQKHFGEWESNNISSHHHQQQHHHQPSATNNNNANPNFLNPSSTSNNNIFDNFNNNFLSSATPHSSTLFPTNSFFSSTSSSTYNNNNNNNNNNNSTQFLDPYPSASTSTNFFLKNKPQVNTSSSFDGSGLYYNSINNDYRRIGLNLGHRTYFSSRESTMMLDRLVRRPRGFYLENQVPRCQAAGCNVELTHAKHYHRRHKVCEFHSKATKVVAGGIEQRFCQQCSRFHVLSEFDESKRSCRKRLADHNRRRRKPHQPSGPSNDSSPAVKPVASENETGNLQMGSSSSRSTSELAVVHDHNNNQHQDMSLSSSSATLSLMIPKCTTTTNNHNPIPTSKAADTSSLMTHFISKSCSPPSSGPHHSPHEHNPSQPFISTAATSPSAVSLSSYQNLLYSNVNTDEQHHREDDSQDDELTLQRSAGDQYGASTTSEHHQLDHEDLHNLLHLRQAMMFDVEFD